MLSLPLERSPSGLCLDGDHKTRLYTQAPGTRRGGLYHLADLVSGNVRLKQRSLPFGWERAPISWDESLLMLERACCGFLLLFTGALCPSGFCVPVGVGTVCYGPH